jgi:hypothetical protein
VDQELLSEIAMGGFVVPELDPNAANAALTLTLKLTLPLTLPLPLPLPHRLKAGKEMIIERVVGVIPTNGYVPIGGKQSLKNNPRQMHKTP